MDQELHTFDFSELRTSVLNDENGGDFNLSQRLVTTMNTEGFVVLRNTGLDESMIMQAFFWGEALFKLDDITKKYFQHGPSPLPHRGYSAIGQERSGGNAFNHKESYDLGPKHDDLYPNLWPPETTLQGFRSFMEEFFDKLYSVQVSLLGVLEDGIKVPRGTFCSMHSKAQNELRLLHYPDVKTGILRDPRKAVRFGDHTDFGTITILFQDPAGGLEFQSTTSAWQEVLSGPTDAVVMFGDTFQRWTNGKLRAGPHRVRAPSQAGDFTGERYAIAYFCKANRDQSVGVLPEFKSYTEESKYANIKAEEYNQTRMQGLY
ncbi:hypothetical protein LTR10_023874 [Elasticomyces elasticus]|uniref:Fe2OG dioxygenase domain-containing protein n=1 Tax=Exophiala sideris TaxID=1016849 RepID=A0ABR0IWF7_9EURO|nr:hypothetical protein LTR10_023874 [Elasticomyces elasticus]KAK5049149.1 hypothetical protein LTR69_011176 [Exophiala sideris]